MSAISNTSNYPSTTNDLDVDNYTADELIAVLNLDNPNEDDIVKSTNSFMRRFVEGSPFFTFFQQAQQKLVQYIRDLKAVANAATAINSQTQEWAENNALPQDDPIQTNKVTDRDHQIEVYGNQHVPMARKQIAVNNTFDTKIAQDKLNPNLENVTSRVIVLDSQYRQMDGGSNASSTDYTLDLSETLSNVVSLRLFSIQIPFNWYSVDTAYGNTCIWITNRGNTFLIDIAPGNYSPTLLCSTLNSAFVGAGFSNSLASFASYNSNTGKITFSLGNGSTRDPSGNIIAGIDPLIDMTNEDPYITFFDFTRKLQCKEHCASPGMYFDRCLGWTMGFRLPICPIYNAGNVGTAIVNLFGPKYFILVIDDYNQNHINNGVVNIAELSSRLSMPSYYSPDMPYTCIPTSNNASNLTNVNYIAALQANANNVNPNNVAGLILENSYLSTDTLQTVLPSAPRILTQAQIYTINEIIKNREKTISFRGKPPSSSDALAIIPLKIGGLAVGDMYVELGGSLQDNKRVYFGPVNIERMRVRLLDDKGNTVNLNGGDWACTLICENLYQY
jgi:hypothetical protein